jgi:hypothetical protein
VYGGLGNDEIRIGGTAVGQSVSVNAGKGDNTNTVRRACC